MCMVHRQMIALLFISNEICTCVNDCMILHDFVFGDQPIGLKELSGSWILQSGNTSVT